MKTIQENSRIFGAASERFSVMLHLLMEFRRQDEARGIVYLDEKGRPLPPLENPKPVKDSPSP